MEKSTTMQKAYWRRKDDESLRNKIFSLKTISKTKLSIHPVLVTTYGLKEGAYSGRIQAVVTTDDLFR